MDLEDAAVAARVPELERAVHSGQVPVEVVTFLMSVRIACIIGASWGESDE